MGLRNYLQGLALWIDYGLYILFSPYKFKTFPNKIKRILVVEELLIGDLIVTGPSIRALKHKFNAQIDILVNKDMQEVAESLPYINKVVTDKDKLDKNYDIGIIFHKGSLSTSYSLLKNKVKYRIGCTKVGVLSGKGYFLNKKILPNVKEQHKIDDNLDVIRSIGVETMDKSLELLTDRDSDKKIKNLFKEAKLKKFKVVIHPGANYKKHEWVKERYQKVIDFLDKELKCNIIITGAPKDVPLADFICKNTNAIILDLAGKTTIKEFFSVIKSVNLVISVDTSAMHVAAAFKKPVVTIFGGGFPKVWYPYTEKKIVLNKNNRTDNIKDDDVINAIKVLIKNETKLRMW